MESAHQRAACVAGPRNPRRRGSRAGVRHVRTYTLGSARGVYNSGLMRRVQIHLNEELDRAAATEAERRGVSKAALIRASLAKELGASPSPEAAWTAMTGWLEDGGVDDIDDAVYGPGE